MPGFGAGKWYGLACLLPISTGVFGYPKQAAAEVAVDAVNRWLTATQSPMVVVFDVFSDEDAAIYRGLLGF